ncbi:hypothetical protein PENTCL1PPCAC_24953, partial [Pristionchus entomophagus]
FKNQTRQQSTYVDPYTMTYKFITELPSVVDEGATSSSSKQTPVHVHFHNGDENGARVSINGNTLSISGNMYLAQPIIDLKADGKPVTTQIFSKKAGE